MTYGKKLFQQLEILHSNFNYILLLITSSSITNHAKQEAFNCSRSQKQGKKVRSNNNNKKKEPQKDLSLTFKANKLNCFKVGVSPVPGGSLPAFFLFSFTAGCREVSFIHSAPEAIKSKRLLYLDCM